MYTGRSKGFGFVEMPSEADANAAIDGLNEKDLKGRSLRLIGPVLVQEAIKGEEIEVGEDKVVDGVYIRRC